MERHIITTKDGSRTIRIEEWNEHYHSTHGAIQESQHVYIKSGLEHYKNEHQPEKINVLEAGFGTGLNALLTYVWANRSGISIEYSALEAYPISQEEKAALKYYREIEDLSAEAVFDGLHSAKWEQLTSLSDTFSLSKHHLFFSELKLFNEVDVIFYDAFGPRVQPELWEASAFQPFVDALKPDGILVTYSVKGTAKRALQSLGLKVEIIEGPPGKRHMMRATK